MTELLSGRSASSETLTIAAAALLTRAVGRYQSTRSPLGEEDIPMREPWLRSTLGGGACSVTADQAWDELSTNGLSTGTRQRWVPVVEEVGSDGA